MEIEHSTKIVLNIGIGTITFESSFGEKSSLEMAKKDFIEMVDNSIFDIMKIETTDSTTTIEDVDEEELQHRMSPIIVLPAN